MFYNLRGTLPRFLNPSSCYTNDTILADQIVVFVLVLLFLIFKNGGLKNLVLSEQSSESSGSSASRGSSESTSDNYNNMGKRDRLM